MNTDTHRPLPTDIGVLRQHYLPDEPETSVSAWRATISRIDTATAAVRAEVDEADERQRAVVAELVDAAADGRDMTPTLGGYRSGRAHAELRLQLLGLARNLAFARLNSAENHDPDFLAWRAQCQTITTEWQLTGSAETPEQRYSALLEFAANH